MRDTPDLFCPACASERTPDAHFCSVCGTPYSRESSPAAHVPLILPHVEPGRDFVGRRAELALLAQFAEQALNGKGRRVILRGESGIGKTAVLAQMAPFLSDNGFSVFSLAGQPEFVHASFFPFQQMVSSLLGLTPDTSPPGPQWLKYLTPRPPLLEGEGEGEDIN